MIREVGLVSYLPGFMQGYREPVATLRAEDPEFAIVWDGMDRILHNRFISTADEYGIRRFERLLHISPSDEDTLESRRSRCQSKWANQIPYTKATLALKLGQLLGGSHNLSLHPSFEDGYGLLVVVYSTDDSQVEELKRLLEAMVPVDMEVDIVYEPVTSGLTVYGGALMEQADILELRQI